MHSQPVTGRSARWWLRGQEPVGVLADWREDRIRALGKGSCSWAVPSLERKPAWAGLACLSWNRTWGAISDNSGTHRWGGRRKGERSH